jgi:monoamine oxidase
MPTLFTALLARHTKKTTLAPKNQRPPAHAKIEKLSDHQHQELVAATYAGAFAKMVFLEEPQKSVCVVGAGLAGLSAAYELRRRGYSVRILEASDRVGGRTWSNHDLVKHHVMERGAELIGANHPLWLTYADTFHLGFSDVKEYEDSPLFVNGQRLSGKAPERLFKHMQAAFDFISSQSKTIVDPFHPWTDPAASTLDEKDVHTFVMRTDWNDRCKLAILQQLESDNGVPAKNQSLLGLLSMVKGGGMERYWEDTEVYRCKRGVQSLALAFEAALLGMNVSVELNTEVTAVDATTSTVKLTTNQHTDPIECQDVILTIPPSAWSTIKTWSPLELSRSMSPPYPQMGKNTKALFAFDHRFWRHEGKPPTATLKRPVDQTWETTETYKKPKFGIVAFSGAQSADDLSRLTDGDALDRVAARIGHTYKNFANKVVAKEFENWPTRQWTWASYSFPRCGDIMTWGPKLYDGYADKIHFAGEHTCYAFTGYMEGALQSGYRLARRLVHRDRSSWVIPKVSLA